MTKKEFVDAIIELEEKYSGLVWYARKAPKEDERFWADIPESNKEVAFAAIAYIEKAYPTETNDIADEEIGDWSHGFNSGMLAAIRFVLTSLTDSVEEAEAEFPSLDT